MTDIVSTSLMPLGLTDERVSNGVIASAQLGILLSTAIRHLAGAERHPPTCQTGNLTSVGGTRQLEIPAAGQLDFYFKVKPYLRDVAVKILIDTQTGGAGEFAEYAQTVLLDIGGTVSTESLNFTGLGSISSEMTAWRSVFFGNVGPSPGKADNGTSTAGVLSFTGDPTNISYLRAFDLVQMHTSILDQP